MEYSDLVDFLENRMRMSHIYQPLLIKSLVEAGGSATVRQISHAFLSQDESQLIYYEKRIKEMPLRVLCKHGIVSKDGELVLLNTEKLTFEQKAKIRMICEQKLQEFLVKKGLGAWDYRFLDTDPVPGVIRLQVLRESGGRCALCGATKKERPLDIDHIIPKSKGGKNVYENLQVLVGIIPVSGVTVCMPENAVASAGTDGVGPGFMKLLDCIMIIEFDITGLESAAGSIGPINFEAKLTE